MQRTTPQTVTATAATDHLPLLDGIPTQAAPARTQLTPDAARCAYYRWCYKTGEHDDHTSNPIEALIRDAWNHEVLHTFLVEMGDGVKVGLLDLDLTPAEAHVVVAALRAHLDAIEKLIDTAEASE